MPNKLTDTEIKKGLECKSEEMICAVVGKDNNTYFITNQVVLDLINRQEGEKSALIEHLKKSRRQLKTANEKTTTTILHLQTFLAEQKAENESLKAEVERLKNLTLEKCCDNCVHEEKTLQADPCCECFNYRNFTPKNYLKQIKAEAYKEFANRLTDKIMDNIDRSLDNPNGNDYVITDVYETIDNLLNELVGDKNV